MGQFRKILFSAVLIGAGLSVPAQAQQSDNDMASQAMTLLEACPKMSRTEAEGQKCFEAEKGMDRILANSMSDEARGIIEAARVLAVSRVATHYILTSKQQLGCEHANRWRQDHDKNIAFLRRTGQGEFADSMVQTNANFGEIQQKCMNEYKITGVAAPLTNTAPRAVPSIAPVASQSRSSSAPQASSGIPRDATAEPEYSACMEQKTRKACETVIIRAREMYNYSGIYSYPFSEGTRAKGHMLEATGLAAIGLTSGDGSLTREVCQIYEGVNATVAKGLTYKQAAGGESNIYIKGLMDMENMATDGVARCRAQYGMLPVFQPVQTADLSLPSSSSRPAIWNQSYNGSGKHPLVNHSAVAVCIKGEPGDTIAQCRSLAKDSLDWQNKPGQSLSEQMVGYHHEYAGLFGEAKNVFQADQTKFAPFCTAIRKASVPLEKAKPYFSTNLSGLAEISQAFLIKQDDLHQQMLGICVSQGY